MKFNLLKLMVSIGVSVFIAYGFYSLYDGEGRLLLGVGSLLFLLSTTALSLAASFQQTRTTTMARTTAAVFFMIAFIINLLFSLIGFSAELYVVTNGIAYLIFIWLIYSISKAKQ